MITGSIVAIVTPMHEDGSLDLNSLRNLVDFHVREGTDAIVIVVSEETGIISIVRNGIIRRRLDEGQVSRLLYRWYQAQTQASPDWFSRFLRPNQNGQPRPAPPPDEGLPAEDDTALEKPTTVGRSDG